jgi:hypothetical protein
MGHVPSKNRRLFVPLQRIAGSATNQSTCVEGAGRERHRHGQSQYYQRSLRERHGELLDLTLE